jgi:protein-tyrosine phosphatase
MIDTHSHILPGLDDGSPDVAHSLRMAEAAVSAGVTKIVCTPHMREFDLGLAGRAREVLQDFRSELSARAIELTLVLGFEVDICVATALPSDQLRLVTIEGSEMTLLLEMPHWGWPTHVRDTLFRLRSDGITPMLAHPERNDRIQRSPDLLEECIDSGAIVQATAASIDGTFGHAAKSAFFRHLSLGHVSILATDAHANHDW